MSGSLRESDIDTAGAAAGRERLRSGPRKFVLQLIFTYLFNLSPRVIGQAALSPCSQRWAAWDGEEGSLQGLRERSAMDRRPRVQERGRVGSQDTGTHPQHSSGDPEISLIPGQSSAQAAASQAWLLQRGGPRHSAAPLLAGI